MIFVFSLNLFVMLFGWANAYDIVAYISVCMDVCVHRTYAYLCSKKRYVDNICGPKSEGFVCIVLPLLPFGAWIGWLV